MPTSTTLGCMLRAAVKVNAPRDPMCCLKVPQLSIDIHSMTVWGMDGLNIPLWGPAPINYSSRPPGLSGTSKIMSFLFMLLTKF